MVGHTASLDRRHQDFISTILRWTGLSLVATVWISAVIFGAYILAFYGGAISANHMEDWNRRLPDLYDAKMPSAVLSMGAHLITGTALLLLGPVQLFGSLRCRWPAVHRWIGRVYVASAVSAGLGGLIFVLLKGTIGGMWMSIGFGLSGALTILSALLTFYYARVRKFELHRAWGIRLFALVIGSWLYRIEYGLWLGLFGGGHTHTFDGSVDLIMDFFFYLPNLVLAEIHIRSETLHGGAVLRGVGSTILALACALIVVSTYFFTVQQWGGPIMNMLFGQRG